MADDDTVSIALAKDEVPVYRILCREHGIDPGQYLSSRRLEFPKEHVLEVLAAHVLTGGDEVFDRADEMTRDKVSEAMDEADILHAGGNLVDKMLDATAEAGHDDWIDETVTEWHDRHDGEVTQEALREFID